LGRDFLKGLYGGEIIGFKRGLILETGRGLGKFRVNWRGQKDLASRKE